MISLQPLQIPGRSPDPAPFLFFLILDILLDLLAAAVADRYHTVGRIPEVPSPQLLFDRRVHLKQLSGCPAFQDPEHIRNVKLGTHIYKQVDVDQASLP